MPALETGPASNPALPERERLQLHSSHIACWTVCGWLQSGAVQAVGIRDGIIAAGTRLSLTGLIISLRLRKIGCRQRPATCNLACSLRTCIKLRIAGPVAFSALFVVFSQQQQQRMSWIHQVPVTSRLDNSVHGALLAAHTPTHTQTQHHHSAIKLTSVSDPATTRYSLDILENSIAHIHIDWIFFTALDPPGPVRRAAGVSGGPPSTPFPSTTPSTIPSPPLPLGHRRKPR